MGLCFFFFLGGNKNSFSKLMKGNSIMRLRRVARVKITMT